MGLMSRKTGRQRLTWADGSWNHVENLLINPEGQAASANQRSVVLRPILHSILEDEAVLVHVQILAGACRMRFTQQRPSHERSTGPADERL